MLSPQDARLFFSLKNDGVESKSVRFRDLSEEYVKGILKNMGLEGSKNILKAYQGGKIPEMFKTANPDSIYLW